MRDPNIWPAWAIALAGEYDRLKIDLAETCKDDREAYTEGKADFIAKALLAEKP